MAESTLVTKSAGLAFEDRHAHLVLVGVRVRAGTVSFPGTTPRFVDVWAWSI